MADQTITALKSKPTHGLKRGVYETEYGNAAYVSGPAAKSAYDLDMAELVPMSEVTGKFIRKAEPTDCPSSRSVE